jgi:alkanesulfonate monooxygenase SsuD/methylene tetrahydromethanopterin reductase-like flavin-dependent oxidoreductase (luciferase family)
VPNDRLAYAALVYTGETEAAAYAGAEKLLWYITSNKVPPHFAAPPGYVPVDAGVRMLRGAEHPLSAFAKSASVEAAIAAGIMMAGTPAQVEAQIRKVYDHVGGFGHLLIMGQAGFLEHDETVAGIRMFAREVYPRVRAW